MAAYQASAVILAALEGLSLTAEELSFFQKHPPAGFTLFRRNLAPDYRSVRGLTAALQSLAPAATSPLLLAIDQEGGRVARLRAPFPDQGPALQLARGAVDGEALQEISNYGFIVATSLRGLGFNIDFAPVLDIMSREDNHAIGDRCFAREAEGVALRAGAFLSGLQAGGVWGCLKHFPGQGDASLDTHAAGTEINADRDLLDARELLPYRRLLGECPMVMISHAVYPALDAVRPASLSATIMQDLLRGEMGYKGLIVTDDMNMKAIDQAKEPWCEAIVAALAAGGDLLLVCRELERYRWALEAIQREAARSPAFAARLEEAVGRVQRLRAQT